MNHSTLPKGSKILIILQEPLGIIRMTQKILFQRMTTPSSLNIIRIKYQGEWRDLFHLEVHLVMDQTQVLSLNQTIISGYWTNHHWLEKQKIKLDSEKLVTSARVQASMLSENLNLWTSIQLY